MKIAFFDTHKFERSFFESANLKFKFDIHFFETRLTTRTANLAAGFSCVCSFVNDRLDEDTLRQLSAGGTKLIALRSAGFNHVDLAAADRFQLTVVRVPEYSPYAVAEHAVALILTLNRKTHRAYNRVREGNFTLDGLVGFDLHGKTVGVIGTGRIGTAMAKIMLGFGCHVLAFDTQPNENLVKLGVVYKPLQEILKNSDIVSLHVPLNPQTRHMVDTQAFHLMKPNAILINTGRGALIDTQALIKALKANLIAGAGLDVYEEEEGIFFENLSDHVIQDDLLARLLTFPNVILTSHQAFLTQEALSSIAETTLKNISLFAQQMPLANEVHADTHIKK